MATVAMNTASTTSSVICMVSPVMENKLPIDNEACAKSRQKAKQREIQGLTYH